MAAKAALRTMRSLRRIHPDALGKRLAVGPHGAVGKRLLLPDRHRFLERVDQPAGSIVSLRTMCRRHDDQYAGFADRETTQPVHDAHVPHAKALPRLLRELAHL